MRKQILLAAVLIILVSILVWLLIPRPAVQKIVEPVKPPKVNSLFTEHIFNIKEKKQPLINIVNIRKEGNLYYFSSRVIKKGKKDVITEAKLNTDFETKEWKFTNPEKNIKVTAVRKENKILLTGTFDNKENNKKEINIDERKWQQIYQLGFMKFAVSSDKANSIEFWCLNPDEPGNAMVLVAAKESREIIELNGSRIKTAKLKICLAGLLSVFWTGDYWFRLSDGFFVKAKVSGDLFVELKQEKKTN